MGDFGSATETMRIIDLYALLVFAKNLDRCNFRVLQHYRRQSGKHLLPASISGFDPKANIRVRCRLMHYVQADGSLPLSCDWAIRFACKAHPYSLSRSATVPPYLTSDKKLRTSRESSVRCLPPGAAWVGMFLFGYRAPAGRVSLFETLGRGMCSSRMTANQS